MTVTNGANLQVTSSLEEIGDVHGLKLVLNPAVEKL